MLRLLGAAQTQPRLEGAAAASASAAASAATSASSIPVEVQRQIEAALPPRGSLKQRSGAAGTPLDQQRESPIVETSLLLAEAVLHGLRTIAFCKTRKLCELVAAYTRENLLAVAPHKAGMVKVRAGAHMHTCICCMHVPPAAAACIFAVACLQIRHLHICMLPCCYCNARLTAGVPWRLQPGRPPPAGV